MRIYNVSIVEHRKYCELRALVKCDTDWVWGSEPFPLWFRYPARIKPWLSVDNGDPYLAALMPVAMALGECLIIEPPVSAKLIQSLSSIQEIYRAWDTRMANCTVQATHRAEPVPGPSAIGLFFSMGVDSSYALLKNWQQHPRDANSIRYLIPVEGFDIYLWETGRFPPLLTSVEGVARLMGKAVLPVATNLRELSDQVIDWVDLYHGAALASIALALGGLLGRVHISAGQTFSPLFKSGSHPLLDPLWSTETLAVVHDGLEATRLDKLRRIADSVILLQHLRVCATDDTHGIYNCGRCEKCLRTMLGLEAVGALEQCRTLPHTIDPELVRDMTFNGPAVAAYLREIHTAIPEGELRVALAECLQRNKPNARTYL